MTTYYEHRSLGQTLAPIATQPARTLTAAQQEALTNAVFAECAPQLPPANVLPVATKPQAMSSWLDDVVDIGEKAAKDAAERMRREAEAKAREAEQKARERAQQEIDKVVGGGGGGVMDETALTGGGSNYLWWLLGGAAALFFIVRR